MKKILIIGGMGPQASLELHDRIITAAAKQGATDGDEFPEILHASLPITDFISSDKFDMAASMINEMTSRLYLWRRSTSGYCL